MPDSALRTWWAAGWAHFRRRRLAYAVSASAVIVALSSFPISIPGDGRFNDKIAHGLAYCLLGITYINVATKGFGSYGAVRLTAAFGAVAVFGALDEWRQSFVPGRVMEFADFAADTVGGIGAVLLSVGISHIYAKLRS